MFYISNDINIDRVKKFVDKKLCKESFQCRPTDDILLNRRHTLCTLAQQRIKIFLLHLTQLPLRLFKNFKSETKAIFPSMNSLEDGVHRRKVQLLFSILFTLSKLIVNRKWPNFSQFLVNIIQIKMTRCNIIIVTKKL